LLACFITDLKGNLDQTVKAILLLHMLNMWQVPVWLCPSRFWD